MWLVCANISPLIRPDKFPHKIGYLNWRAKNRNVVITNDSLQIQQIC